ncbi:MAG: hypothetical protein JSR71_04155 [Proteobacteria bacterium]|nr:hypothetical protein [Pseudomonadota bacterium]
MKIIFWLVFASALIYASFFTEKDRLDREVKRLCAIDGGIKVYETVRLPAERFDRYGKIKIQTKEHMKSIDEYYIDYKSNYLVIGNPRLMQINVKIVRAKDGKVMGEFTQYTRGGGDMPGPWHGSSFSCPSSFLGLEALVFVRGVNDD